MKYQSIIKFFSKNSQIWSQKINDQPNQYPCHLIITNQGENYTQQLISIESPDHSLQFVQFNKLKQKYLVVAEIILTLVNFQIIPIEDCKKFALLLKKSNIIGARIIKEDQSINLFTQSEETFKLLHSKLVRSCAKTNLTNYYQILSIINHGKKCLVSKAQNIFTGQNFSIKILSKTQEKYLDHKATIVNEITIQKQLVHPNILNIKEIFVQQHNICIVTEFLDGMSLIERIKTNDQRAFKLTHFNIQLIMYQLFNAVDYMHKKGFMHRDLKPENLLFRNMSNKYEIIICDFGYADSINDPKRIYTKCGTPGYTAPEILNYIDGDDFYDEKCDIYSLGVIFYLLLTGKNLFQGRTSSEIIQKNSAGRFNFNEPILQNRPVEVIELLQKLLEYSPKSRISAAQALLHPYFNKKFKDDLANKIDNHSNQSRNSSKNSQKVKPQISTQLMDRNLELADSKQEAGNNLLEISPSLLKTKSNSPGIFFQNSSQIGSNIDRCSTTKIQSQRVILSQVDEKQSSETGSSFLYFDTLGNEFDKHPSIQLEYQMNFEFFIKNKACLLKKQIENEYNIPKIRIFTVDN